jgi:hypothetical protein
VLPARPGRLLRGGIASQGCAGPAAAHAFSIVHWPSSADNAALAQWWSQYRPLMTPRFGVIVESNRRVWDCRVLGRAISMKRANRSTAAVRKETLASCSDRLPLARNRAVVLPAIEDPFGHVGFICDHLAVDGPIFLFYSGARVLTGLNDLHGHRRNGTPRTV